MGGDLLGDGQQVQQAISWNQFSLLCTTVLFVLQQVGLFYFIAQYSLSWLFLCAADVVLLLLLLQSHSSDYAATEGGTCWVVYCWTLSTKYLLFFFGVYAGGGPQPGVLLEGPTAGVLEVGLLFSLSAGIYAFLAFRAAGVLFGGLSSFSFEALLHTDAATHVAFDLLDGVAAFYAFALLPRLVQQQNPWLHALAGVLVPVSVFLHGYSFPTVGGTGGGTAAAAAAASAPAARRDLHSSSEVHTMRKHAAIVGVFFVDLPLLSLRLFVWAYYPSYTGFSPFMFKNICFIPIQLARLRQCAAAERAAAALDDDGATGGGATGAPVSGATSGGRGSRAQRGLTGGDASALQDRKLPRNAAAVIALEELAAKEGLSLYSLKETTATKGRHFGLGFRGRQDAQPKKKQKGGPPYRALPTPSQEPDAAVDSDSNNNSYTQQQQHQKLASGGEKTGSKGFSRWKRQTNKSLEAANSPEESLIDYEASLARLVEVCEGSSEATRRLPVAGFAARRVLQRLLYAFRQLGSRHGAAMLLGRGFPVSFGGSTKLSLPFMMHLTCQLALVATVFYFYEHWQDFPVGLFSLRSLIAGDFSWTLMALEVRVAVVLIASFMFLSFCLFAFSSPIIDCLFTCLFGGLRLFSFFLVLLTFRDFGVFSDLLQLASSGSFPLVGKYCLFFFAVEPLLGLLVSLYPFISVLLGRQSITYVVPPMYTNPKTAEQSAPSHRQPEIDFSQMGEAPRGDERETVSTASLMLFTSCRSMVVPLSVHQLLVGPNLIKAVRMNDGLLRSHWRSVLVSLLLRIWCCCLYFSFPGSVLHPVNFTPGAERLLGLPWYGVCSLATFVFCGDILLSLFYLATSQLVRLLAIRQMENKAIFRDLAAIAFKIKEERLRACLGMAGGVGLDPQQLGLEVHAVWRRFSRHCFFTYPGELLPPFF